MNPLALIAEDEALLAEHLRQELARLWPELRLLPVAPHGQAAVEAALAHQPQVCFLDIRMPGLSGLEVAATLAEEWPEEHPFPLIVFVTAYDQYALQAFEHAAQDYLLKPVQTERLQQCCERLQRSLAARQGQGQLGLAVDQLRQLLGTGLASPGSAPAPQRLRLLQVAAGTGIQMVPVAEVLFFEAADKYVRVVTQGKEHLVRISLRELLPQLDPELFWQVHRGTVVRADAIERAQRDEAGRISLQLRGSAERLGVSRMYAHLFKAL